MRCASFVLLCLALTSVAHAENWTLRTAARDTPPYYSLDAQHQAHGACPELLSALERKLPGLNVIGKERPLSLALHDVELQQGSLDILCGVGATDARRAAADLLHPLWESRHRLLVRKDDPGNVSSLEELRTAASASPVLARRMSTFADKLKSQGIAVDDNSNENEVMLRKLLAQRGRYLYGDELLLQALIRQDGLDRRLRMLPTVFHRQALYFLAAKRLDASKRQQLQTALQTMEQDGTLPAIRKKYGLAGISPQ
ncbi:substrate-binding periplasmic protein [Chitinilyticum litopenaei]|uniref:substrate-binding periplasmic protein n=1 Tax=Chitinilyticum litopenaei TaxID=1121276 RepID=UPI0004106397|nr:transporter substrate-binding domain-containing protein [Chitinilyticum litopenaei]